MNLGERLKERRQTLKISQQELAQALGVTAQHISAIEQEKWSPSLTLLPKLAEELGVTVDYLLTGKESTITDTIPAIKADKTLRLEAKRLLIGLVDALRSVAISEEKFSLDTAGDCNQEEPEQTNDSQSEYIG